MASRVTGNRSGRGQGKGDLENNFRTRSVLSQQLFISRVVLTDSPPRLESGGFTEHVYSRLY